MKSNLDFYWPEEANKKLSANFRLVEFFPKKHKYGPVFIHPELVKRLQKLRELTGRSIKITSGYRPSAYNKRIGGSSKSKHMLGMAVDIWCDMDMGDFAALAYKAGFRRIGVDNKGNHRGFIHVDVHLGEAYWQYFRKFGRKKIRSMEKPKHWKAA